MKANKIDTVLFDLDGTLVDTYDLILESYLHTFEKYAPNQFTREDCIKFIGPSLREAFESVLPEKAEEMMAYYRKFNVEKHDELIKEFDGVFETVKTLHEKGYKLAIVTTKIRETAIQGLKATNLDSFFDTVIGFDDVEKVKPDSEPLQKALDLLGSRAEQAVMVGDSFHDIVGAKNAGVISVACSWSIRGREFLESYEPDYIIDHMSELLKIVGVE